jgi:hypothetical protein
VDSEFSSAVMPARDHTVFGTIMPMRIDSKRA